MALIGSLVHESSTDTTAATSFTIAAISARRRFSEEWSTGGTDVFYYAILHRTVDEWEYGTGHLSDADTLVRDTVLASSNSDALVNFSAGTKDVLNDLPAEFQIRNTGTQLDFSLADAGADAFLGWDDSVGAYENLTAAEASAILAAASDTAQGAVELATTTELLTGTDTVRAATPDAVAALWEKGSNVASAATVSFGEGGYFHVTGTTTITDIDFATAKDGRSAWVIFDGILTLTHNATTLVLPGGVSITTAAGDRALFVQDATDNVYCLIYQRAAGGGSSIITDATPPSSPADGDAWYDLDSGGFFIYVNDGTSSQWVQVGGGAGPSFSAFSTPDTSMTFTLDSDGTPLVAATLSTSGGHTFLTAGEDAITFRNTGGATTADNVGGFVIGARTTGTAGIGFGTDLTFELENASGTDISAGRVIATYSDATAGSEDSFLTFTCRSAGAQDTVARFDADGIKFNTDTAAANALDDYEEGTWTPTLLTTSVNFSSVTYDAVRFGTYTKIGRSVTINGRLRTDAVTVGAATGTVRIGGLPFTTNSTGRVAISVASTVNWLGEDPLHGRTEDGDTNIDLQYRATVDASTTSTAVSDVGTGADANEIVFSLVYNTT